MIVDKRGQISAINSHSGHYIPQVKHIKTIMEHLKETLSRTTFANISVSIKQFAILKKVLIKIIDG